MFKNIYIISFGNILSGGVSSLHNLCEELIQNQYNAKMFYVDANEQFIEHVLKPKFNFLRTNEIIDDESNLLIVPETLPHLLVNYHKTGKIIYWLSLKFFVKNKNFYKGLLRNYFIRKITFPNDFIGNTSGIIDRIKQNMLYRGMKDSVVWQKNIIHITNSFYTYSFCKKMGASNINLLYNPLIGGIFDKKPAFPRKKQILIGARTSKLLKFYLEKTLPDFTVIHVKKMSIETVYEYMSESMVYVDLSTSNRDRAPREAAFLGCIVITSKIGSAKYYQDVPIPNKYKFRNKLHNYPKLKRLIKNNALNYTEIISDFDSINNRTIEERNNFSNEIASIFENLQRFTKCLNRV